MNNKQKAVFKEFLDKNIKNPCYSFEVYIFDLEKQVGETGNNYYELSKFESKSGKTEIFYIEEA